jgi:MFS family permease
MTHLWTITSGRTSMSTTSRSTTPVERIGAGRPERNNPGRAAIRGGILGNYADQFDIFVPVLTLAPALIFFQPPGTSDSTRALWSAVIFASTMLARPIGSTLFGHFADKVGRRRVTMIAVTGFGVSTFAIGLLPGYQQIGGWAIGLLVALRFIGGVFLGGEYVAAIPLAMEWSPQRRRGLVSGLITSMSSAAYATIAVLTLVLLSVMSSSGVDSAYVQWGWRIPFFIGGVLGLSLLFLYWREVEEAPVFKAAVAARSPLRELLTGPYRKDLLQVFVMMTGTWLLANVALAVVPVTLHDVVGLPARTSSIVIVVSALVCVASLIGCGWLSQRTGRRPLNIGIGIAAAVGASLCYVALTTLDVHSLPLVIVLTAAIQAMSISIYGPLAAYLSERFPSPIRAIGYGVGYSIALIAPSFYAFYISGLSVFVGVLAPAVLLALGGVLVAVGAALGPETRDVDMSVPEAVSAHGTA